jgi:hypothetical protein
MEKKFIEKETTNSLGKAQRELELAAKHLQVAQEELAKANAKHQAADERYSVAIAALTGEFNAVRQKTKVVPLAAR